MKGFVGFLIGLIGLCFFAAVSIIVPMTMPRRGDSMVIFMFMIVCAFAFLNIMIVGFYRLLAGLNESALLPEDSYYYPLRGRVLFFIGYVGLLATFGLTLVLAILPEIMRFRVGRDMEALLALAWFVGWTFFGLMMGGVLAMLRDLHQKLYLGGGARSRRYDDDDIDISSASRRPHSHRDARDERDYRDQDWPPRRVPPDDDQTQEQRARKPWDEA
jgi:hypothetical protein